MKKIILIIFCLFPLSSYADLTDSLVSYWDFQETSGTRVDLHSTNDLTDNNTVGYTTGCIDTNSADFEATNDEYLSKASLDGSGLDVTGDWSLSQWVKFETNPSSYPNSVLNWTTWYDNSNRAWATIFGGSTDNEMSISDSGSGGTTANLSWTHSGSTCYHVVFMYDASAGTALLYVNGSQVDTTAGLPTSVYQTNGALYVGGNYWGDNMFDGTQEHVAFWSRLLTDDEITELYNSGTGLFYEDFTAPPDEPPPYLVQGLQRETYASILYVTALCLIFSALVYTVRRITRPKSR